MKHMRRWGWALWALAACSDATGDRHTIDPVDFGPDFGDPLGGRDAAGADGAFPNGDAAPPPPDAAALGDAAPPPPDAAAVGDAAPPDPDAAALEDAAAPDPDAAPPPDPDAAPAAVCGNGAVEPGEACDDRNRGDGDYCAGDCSAITGRCGDGVLQSNERCDDGAGGDCLALRDGGDGVCVPAGQCSPGFVPGADARCEPAMQAGVVDIFVANDCTMRVVPAQVDVPPGRTIAIRYRNRSVDYPVTVWLSYGGGFVDLPPLDDWADQFVHCVGPRRPRQAWADISTACSEHRLMINCQ